MARILVCEDSQAQAMYLKKTLESVGHEVEWAKDGQEGLELAVTSSYDIIVSDVQMPRLTGFELCFKLRSEAGLRLPIVLLTSLHEMNNVLRGRDVGASMYIVKPFKPEELLKRLEKLTEGLPLTAPAPPSAAPSVKEKTDTEPAPDKKPVPERDTSAEKAQALQHLNRLRTENDDLSARLREAEAEAKRLKTDNNDLQTRLKKAEQPRAEQSADGRAQELEQKVERMKAANDALQARLLQAEESNKTSKDDENRLERAEQKAAAATERVQSLEQDVKRLQTENFILKAKQHSSEKGGSGSGDTNEDSSDLSEKVRDLTGQLERQKKENKELAEQVAAAKQAAARSAGDEKASTTAKSAKGKKTKKAGRGELADLLTTIQTLSTEALQNVEDPDIGDTVAAIGEAARMAEEAAVG